MTDNTTTDQTGETQQTASDLAGGTRSNNRSNDTILLPRWVVYFQAALLGIVAATFFIFGMMVTSLTSNSDDPFDGGEVRVFGTVAKTDEGQQVPDTGAVVLLLPDSPVSISRQDPTTIRPDSFEPLENPTIDAIRAQGGSVVRSNIDGKFELFARPGVYNLLIISKTTGNTRQKLSKEQVATISQYFLPVEKLIQDQQFYWQPIRVKDIAIEITDAVVHNTKLKSGKP